MCAQSGSPVCTASSVVWTAEQAVQTAFTPGQAKAASWGVPEFIQQPVGADHDWM